MYVGCSTGESLNSPIYHVSLQNFILSHVKSDIEEQKWVNMRCVVACKLTESDNLTILLGKTELVAFNVLFTSISLCDNKEMSHFSEASI